MRNILVRKIRGTTRSMRLCAARDARNAESRLRTPLRLFCGSVAFCACVTILHAQSSGPARSGSSANDIQAMQERITNLETEVAELKAMMRQLHPDAAASAVATPAALASAFSAPITSPVPGDESQTQSADRQAVLQAEDKKNLEFLRGTTIDLGVDTYYAYNFNHPIGRVNLLRAYDVLSNEFSLNQASVIFDHPPDLTEGRRWGARLDLQLRQAPDTLQGNPLNEPRPEIYRNIFQVYGTYVLPVGQNVTVDFGKWASSIGIEGNYTKDQMNYARSFWFDFLPFYHMGVRATVPLNDKFTINYWVVNGTNQVEATNGFKDELFGFVFKPTKNIAWTSNYYLGQEHPDRTVSATPTNPVPVQPDLNFIAIRPAPNGRTHIFDNYVTLQVNPK